MNKISTKFIQVLVLAFGLAVLAFMIYMPTQEGRNVNSTLFEVYFNDPFLAFAYLGSIAFFVGVYKVFNLVGLAGQGKLYSLEAVKALHTIKYCALIIIGFVAVAEIYIMTAISDDRTGGIMMGALIIAGSIVVATVASKLEKQVKNNLTV
jgi:hypothetical protein